MVKDEQPIELVKVTLDKEDNLEIFWYHIREETDNSLDKVILMSLISMYNTQNSDNQVRVVEVENVRNR